MISHDFKTVFVHIPKTAGQSVEHLFIKAHGLTWKTRAPLVLRPNRDRSKGPERLAHLYADEYVRLGYIEQVDFDTFFKFAIVRNPYDRIISEYRYRPEAENFDAFLGKTYDTDYSDRARHVVPQVRYLFDADGALLVDQIIRFEELSDAFPKIAEQIFGKPAILPKRNTSHPSIKMSRNDLTDAQRALMKEKYANDFALLGYDPEI